MNNLEDDFKHLREELTQLRGDIGKIAETLEHTVKNGGSEAARLAHDAVDEIKTDANKAAKSVSKTIESQPLNSAIVALGAGVVLGLMLRR
jgi:ElaB/YqjD/DUF883 family membrane-anchored ribosome-binding protein